MLTLFVRYHIARKWTEKLIKMRNFKYHNIITYYRSQIARCSLEAATSGLEGEHNDNRDPKKEEPADEEKNNKRRKTLIERLRLVSKGRYQLNM